MACSSALYNSFGSVDGVLSKESVCPLLEVSLYVPMSQRQLLMHLNLRVKDKMTNLSVIESIGPYLFSVIPLPPPECHSEPTGRLGQTEHSGDRDPPTSGRQ